MKTNRYIHPAIELCRNCAGTGQFITFPIWDFLHQTDAIKEVCPVCEGSGRVIVSKKIEVTVEPFKIK